MKKNNLDYIGRDILFGVAVGDALGVPVEFELREDLLENPVTDMRSYGSHHYQPKGTWSDDSSLTFCLAESLLKGYDLRDMAMKMIQWKEHAYWTAYEEVFDIGLTTSLAIERLCEIINKGQEDLLIKLGNIDDENSNGNGSLMRILPLVIHVKDLPIIKQFEIIWQVSALTHYHIRSAISCLIYIRFAENLLNGMTKYQSYQKMQQDMILFFTEYSISLDEQKLFDRLIVHSIDTFSIDEIKSSGYVLDSLEASLWCLLKYDNYKETVLAAVNLGNDTDTIAAISGGLAGILYGFDSIPSEWINDLQKKDEIIVLADKLTKLYKYQ
jgi:ADP-ribosylglycohydrolase